MGSSERIPGITGAGYSTVARDGTVLEAWYPSITLGEVLTTGTVHPSANDLSDRLGRPAADLIRHDARRDVSIVPVVTQIADVTAPAVDLYDVYLRLHLLSSRRLRPEQVSLKGVLDLFTNVAWTSIGPCLPERVDEARWLARAEGTAVSVGSVFPFPRMTDYVAPSGIKIMNAENVRLGAYLAPGTNVLGGGFCNTGSATLGRSAIEGRLSLGVVVGEGSHIGGGASLMGTTSGGGKHVVSIGRNCLVGANAGVGIALGDGCIVEAGCYITAGSRITLPDGRILKAAELSQRPNLLYRRNSLTGKLEAGPAPGWPGLNPMLHGL